MRLLSGWWSERVGQLHLDFGTDPHEKRLTLTFNFLSSVIGLLVALTAIWAISAGVVKSEHLAIQVFGADNRGSQSGFFSQPIFPELRFDVFILFCITIYSFQAFGVAMLVCIAAASAGAIVGFLFGVPRPISESGMQNTAAKVLQGATSTPTGETKAEVMTPAPQSIEARQAPGWQSSTNLTQISDWLTKVIVGVGLVDFYKISSIVSSLSSDVSRQLLAGIAGTKLVLPALMLAGSIFGFMYSYLFTQLFLAALMAYSATLVSNPDNSLDKQVLAELGSADPKIAPSSQGILSSEPAATERKPTEAQQDAATRISLMALSDVNDPDTLLIWSRAQAVLNDYVSAKAGYRKLLTTQRAPGVLAEASRVYAQAGDISGARSLIQEATLHRSDATPVARARITFDAANYSLYDPPPTGYSHALALLEDAIVDADTGGGLHVLRACANGQRHKFEASNFNEAAKTSLRLLILKDLEKALAINAKNVGWIGYLLNQTEGTKDFLGRGFLSNSRTVDDDLADFYNDEEFIALVKKSRPT